MTRQAMWPLCSALTCVLILLGGDGAQVRGPAVLVPGVEGAADPRGLLEPPEPVDVEAVAPGFSDRSGWGEQWVIPVPNVYDVYREAVEQSQRIGPVDACGDYTQAILRNTAMQVNDADMEALIREQETVLAKLHEAAGMQCLLPPAGLQRVSGMVTYDTGGPTHTGIRSLARLLSAAAVLAARQGDTARAFSLVQDAYAMGAGYARGGNIVDSLVAGAVLAVTWRAESYVVAIATRPLDGYGPLVAQRRARRGSLWALGDILREEDRAARMQVAAWNTELPKDADLDQANALSDWEHRYYMDVIAEAQRPLWEADFPTCVARGIADFKRVARVHAFAPEDADEEAFVLHLDKVADRYRQTVALLSASELLAALEAHRASHGQYPDTLQGIAPGILPDIPPDPWTGRAFLYRRTAPGAIVLYCTGPDQRDDGGEGDPVRPGEPDYVLCRIERTAGSFLP